MKQIYTLLLTALLALGTTTAWADAIVTIDDPTLVKMQNSDRDYLTLQPGKNTVATGAYILMPSGNFTINQVSLNGTVMALPFPGATYYSFKLVDGDSLDIRAKAPVSSYPVTIVGAPEGFITSITVAGNPIKVTDSFDAIPDQPVIITADYEHFVVDSIMVNGKSSNMQYGFAFYATGETVIRVYVHSIAVYNTTINVDDPKRVEVRRGGISADPLLIVAGDNSIELNEKNNYLYISATTGNIIQSVTDGTREYQIDGTNHYFIQVEEDGLTITVTSGKRYADAIQSVSASESEAPAYTIGGARAQTNQRGIIVRNGRKVVVK